MLYQVKRPDDFDIFREVVKACVEFEDKHKALEPAFQTGYAQQLEEEPIDI